MKSYIVKLIQTYMDIISLNEDMSNNFDESIRQKQDELVSYLKERNINIIYPIEELRNAKPKEPRVIFLKS